MQNDAVRLCLTFQVDTNVTVDREIALLDDGQQSNIVMARKDVTGQANIPHLLDGLQRHIFLFKFCFFTIVFFYLFEIQNLKLSVFETVQNSMAGLRIFDDHSVKGLKIMKYLSQLYF